MSTELFIERFTRLFEHYTHALGSDSEEDTLISAENIGHADRRLVAAARLALLELERNATRESSARKYFADPGHAEWGC